MEFKSCLVFTNVYDLIDAFLDTDSFSDEYREYLESVNDYQSLQFIVINDQIVLVCDDTNGDVYETISSIQEFSDMAYKNFMEEE